MLSSSVFSALFAPPHYLTKRYVDLYQATSTLKVDRYRTIVD
jgi:hypothetical protein